MSRAAFAHSRIRTTLPRERLWPRDLPCHSSKSSPKPKPRRTGAKRMQARSLAHERVTKRGSDLSPCIFTLRPAADIWTNGNKSIRHEPPHPARPQLDNWQTVQLLCRPATHACYDEILKNFTIPTSAHRRHPTATCPRPRLCFGGTDLVMVTR